MIEKMKIIKNEKIWMEQNAIDQLKQVSEMEGAIQAVGLPDLHAGKSPNGMAFLTEGRFYPHLIGNDIGCGMALFQTGVKAKKVKQSKWVSKLNNIRQMADLEMDNPYDEECPINNFATIGSGNHFIEFQGIHFIENKDLFSKLELDKEKIFMLVHSGSRDYGQRILMKYCVPEGLVEGSQMAFDYMKEHDLALLWAKRNRKCSAQKLLQVLGVDETIKTTIDCCHNYLEKTNEGWLHRKGAVSSVHKAIVIPGSRGSLTYICAPKENTINSLHSLSHGAGRKWARSLCRSRINKKYDRKSIRTTELKSNVVCHDTNLLFQEAPEAYKNIEQVIQTLVEYELIEIVATLKPLITYKG